MLVRELIEAGVPCARGHLWRADHVKKLQHLSKDPHGWAKFIDSAASGGIGPERLSRIEAKLVPQIEAAEERVRAIGVSPVVAGILGADARTAWAGLSLSQKREVLRAVVTPRLLPTKGGRAPFNPDDIMLTWLGAPAAIPGIDESFDDEELLAEVS